MKKLELNQMENVEGGNVECAAGIGGLAFLSISALCCPEVFATVCLTGEGTVLVAGITAQSLDLISNNC